MRQYQSGNNQREARSGEVFPVGKYGTGYAIRVHLLATSRVYIDHCVLQSKWHPDIELVYLEGPLYRMGNMTYHPSEVLNEKLQKPWSLQRGAVVEGLVLGYGGGPLPAGVTSGLESVQITFTDTLGRESRESLPVFVDQPANTETRSNRVAEPGRARLGTLYEPSVSEKPRTEEKVGAQSATASRKQP